MQQLLEFVLPRSVERLQAQLLLKGGNFLLQLGDLLVIAADITDG